jgi:hypothetical protein
VYQKRATRVCPESAISDLLCRTLQSRGIEFEESISRMKLFSFVGCDCPFPLPEKCEASKESQIQESIRLVASAQLAGFLCASLVLRRGMST